MNKKYNITKKFLIQQYSNNEKSCEQIAEELGCHPSTILKTLKKHNLPRRKCGRKHNPERHKEHYCIDCGKEICWQAKRCHKCANILINKNKEINKENYCIDCGGKINYRSKRCTSCASKGKNNYFFGKHHTEETKEKLKIANSGKNSANYIDGTGNFPYPLEFNDKLKLQIRKRDNYTCEKCGITEEEHLIVYGIVLSVHHIDYNKENCKEDNLITLCNECNIRVNYNRDYWTEYFEAKTKCLLKK